MTVRDVAMCTLLLAVASVQASEVAPFAIVAVELKNGEIEAEFRLSSPVERLELARHTTQYRPQSWRVLSAGVTLKESVLVAASGQTFDRVRLSVTALAGPTQKDYDPVLNFTDGGRAIYTGQFDAAPAHGATVFEFRASKNLPVALAGVLHRKPVRYTPEGEGTYAYFGRSRLLELPFGLAVLDPALPAWSLAELRSFLPAVLRHYGDKLGQRPASHPFILFDYDLRPEAGTGLGGDVLPGLVRFGLHGSVWTEDSPKLRRDLRWVIAHEAAHFWNGDSHDETAPWMHEGSADALAHFALHDLGIITSEELADAQDEALNRCLLELDGRSVNEAFRQGRYKAAYDCGHALSLLTGAAMRRNDPRLGLHEFWRTLLELAEQDGGSYHQGHYLANLVKQTGNTRLAALVYSFTNQPFGGVQPLADAFAETGRPLSPASGEPAPEISRALYRKLFEHLMTQDCQGRHSFNALEDRVALNGTADCRTLKQSLAVTGLAGFSLYENALPAYAAVAKACAAGGAVALGGSAPDKTIALPCTKSIPDAPTLMSFKPAPALGAAR